MSQAPTTFEEWWVGSYYRRFVEREGVPLYEGSILEDLSTLPLKDWERRGGKAAYTRLGNQEDVNLQIVEIPAKGELKPEHHMYESIMYVMKGKGASTIWQEGEPRKTVEWEEGALLAVPLNAWHQEFNSSGDEPCRLLFGTNMAQVINLYHNLNSSLTIRSNSPTGTPTPWRISIWMRESAGTCAYLRPILFPT